MRKIIRGVGTVGTALVALFVVAAGRAPAAPPPEPAAAAGPRVTVEKPEIDAGKVTRGKVLEAAFELRNDGDADLRILSAKPG